MRPGISPSSTSSTPSGVHSATAQRNRAVRRSSGTSDSWLSRSALLAASPPASLATPVQRADRTPGMPLRASTHRPESSASDGSPVAARQARALISALPSNVGSVSAGSSYGATSARPSTSMPGTSGSRIRRSSASFLALLDARTTVLPGSPGKRGRVPTSGSPEWPGRPRFSGVDSGTSESVVLQLREVGAALGRELEQRVELGLVERRALGGALHLDELAAAGHHDVHVGLGTHVLDVGQVEQRDAVDDADADRRDRL